MKKLLLVGGIFFVWPAIAFANGNDAGHMGGWGYMMNFWWGGALMWILFLIVIVVVVYFVLQSTRPRSYNSSPGGTSEETSMDILKRHYAWVKLARKNLSK